MTDIEIANSVKPKCIIKVAKALGLRSKNLMIVGDNVAKIVGEKCRKTKRRLILVTSINPTSAGNGKTTVSIGLADAMASKKLRVCLALREPSMGPVFGMKGGATGGGYAQVIPMEDINLNFTGDFHAITSANNLLCSIIDNHIFQGNELNIDPDKILFNRCLDLNDRALRSIEYEVSKNVKRKDNFNITAASEVMAILTIAKDLNDLKNRLGNIMVALTKNGKPVYARDLNAADAMTIILKDAIKPNLVQTLEGNPAIVHCGPFANIAHGCSSLVATNMALDLADYTITEAGFGADLGAEKFIDFKCRIGDLKPNCVVIVATIPALKLHGGVAAKDLKQENLAAITLGFDNLKKHICNMQNVFHTPVVVTLNEYASDTELEKHLVKKLVTEVTPNFAFNSVWANGGKGAIELADLVVNQCEQSYTLQYAYDLQDSIKVKINKIAKQIYGAKKVSYTKEALASIRTITKLGYDNLPIIMAKTQYSLSDDKDLLGAPKGFEITVRDLELRTGAGFVVVLLGKMLLMPGLNKTPAYAKMKIDEKGNISGLY